MPHAGVFMGADFVMPGPDLSPKAIADLIVDERVTFTAGVPTIWSGALPFLAGRDTSALRMIVCGGSAVPKALSEAYRTTIGLPISQAWGMTETSPIAAVATVKSHLRGGTDDEMAELRATCGPIAPLAEVRIVEPNTVDELAWDGEQSGELQVRGPCIASEYYNDERSPQSFTADGWLRTGDVATIDPDGYVRLVDRTKDLVKSGGEWISSVEVENELMAHPAVAEAAVVGVFHPRWEERPLACVVLREGHDATSDEILEFLRPRMAKWWLPDEVVFIDQVPKTSVGKFDKKVLRARFAEHRLPSA